MTEARCPLVREIEEDIATNGESFRGSILRERYEQIRAALEAAEEIDKTLNDGISAVQDVLQAAYHRCFLACCGRAGYECCGSPVQSWSAEDQRIMDVLGPIEKQMREALARYHAATRKP